MPPAAPPPPGPDRREVVEILDRLEASFYTHWGAVERTREFARLSAAHVPLLREIAEANGDRALAALRVLDRLAPGEGFTPGARAILYASALGRERNFLRWGTISDSGFLPGVYGDEILTLGEIAAAPLRRLLGEVRRATVVGARWAEGREDRVCDYAWVLLSAICGRPFEYPRDPRDRDTLIRSFDLWLGRRLSEKGR